MLNHGLVVVPLFLIIGVIALRARGSESLAELGGMAFRAPVLAALFLIISLATLAMPGSGNFVGEILILFGTFEDKLVYGLVASVGVVLAAVYMIRLYQGTMHGRVGRRRSSRVRSTGVEPGGDRAAGGGDRRARRVPATSWCTAPRRTPGRAIAEARSRASGRPPRWRTTR